MNEDIDLGDATTGTGSEKSRSSGGSSRSTKSEREPVFIKKEYGTEMFEKDTDCRFCDSKAEGVLRYKGELLGEEESMVVGWPICTEHRRELTVMEDFRLDDHVYNVFEVEDE
jgi:hypothetical protein